MPKRQRLSPWRFARRMGFYRGLLGGSRAWLAIGGVVWAMRLVRRMAGKREVVAATEVLQPGQWVRIEALLPPPPRR